MSVRTSQNVVCENEWDNNWAFRGRRDSTGTSVSLRAVHGRELPLPLFTEIANHSPAGFEWGYGGSGPTQLALAMVSFSVLAASQFHLWTEEEPASDSFLCPTRWRHGLSWAAREPDALLADEISELKRCAPALTALASHFKASVSSFNGTVWRIPLQDMIEWLEAAAPVVWQQSNPFAPGLSLPKPPQFVDATMHGFALEN